MKFVQCDSVGRAQVRKVVAGEPIEVTTAVTLSGGGCVLIGFRSRVVQNKVAVAVVPGVAAWSGSGV